MDTPVPTTTVDALYGPVVAGTRLLSSSPRRNEEFTRRRPAGNTAFLA
jgi:hypothetical protein